MGLWLFQTFQLIPAFDLCQVGTATEGRLADGVYGAGNHDAQEAGVVLEGRGTYGDDDVDDALDADERRDDEQAAAGAG